MYFVHYVMVSAAACFSFLGIMVRVAKNNEQARPVNNSEAMKRVRGGSNA